MLNGSYCHFGLISELKEKLMSLPGISYNTTIYISFNVGGLPIFHKTGKYQLWPILAHIKNFKSGPFVVGLFMGTGKPDSVSIFLEDFLNSFWN